MEFFVLFSIATGRKKHHCKVDTNSAEMWIKWLEMNYLIRNVFNVLRPPKKLELNVMTSSSDDKNADCILPYFRLYN